MRIGRWSRIRRDGLAGLAMVVAGCGGPAVDIRAALQVVDVTSGWVDAGSAPVGGGTTGRPENKLVPTISFRLDNTSTEPLRSRQVNGVFRRDGEELVWGTALVRAFGREGLHRVPRPARSRCV